MSTFEIRRNAGDDIELVGRLDTSHADTAERFLAGVETSCVMDLSRLDFISSSGLGVLLITQKRLAASGASLKLVRLNERMRHVFRYSGFDKVFDIEDGES